MAADEQTVLACVAVGSDKVQQALEIGLRDGNVSCICLQGVELAALPCRVILHAEDDTLALIVGFEHDNIRTFDTFLHVNGPAHAVNVLVEVFG